MVNIEESALSLDQTPCTALKGVGPKISELLKKLNIITVQDLLFHLPLRYEDRTVFKTMNQLTFGDHVQVEGEIIHSEIHQGRRKSLICKIRDVTGHLNLRFFYFNKTQEQLFTRVGRKVRCYGEIRRGPTGYEMIHPEYHFVTDDATIEIEDTLTPIYPATEGLNQYVLRKLTDQALVMLNNSKILDEYLPQELLINFGFPDLISAVNYVHRPPQDALALQLNQGLHLAQQRLAFEELLAHQLILARMRLRTKILQGPQVQIKDQLVAQYKLQLPFQLTSAQKRVIDHITSDLQKNVPMLRLVQGDVGSGKTVVAAIAALHVIENGFQVALMAPTELLSEQHYRNFSQWFNPLGINVGWLTGNRGKQRDNVIEQLSLGTIQVAIGTHALFQEKTNFNKLGLIIIDEQHRFGVDQRLSLLHKGASNNHHPHQLVMSATPIPRTLAMTAYADLDCSAIDELPPGRTPVRTIVLPHTKRPQLIERLRVNCQQGAQAYWVCTLIQESELLQCQAAEEVTQELTVALPELRIALIHGRMKSKEKEEIMLSFKNKEIDLLVATTVIEVGVDVPNATLMIIENSERLGLAQLHQLRGRVGRGTSASHCVLLYQPPISKLAFERLGVLRDNNDGFVIAEKDLELRGPGEVLGTKQTGLIQLKIADLIRDQHILPKVQKAAELLLQDHSERVEKIVERWIADNQRFSEV